MNIALRQYYFLAALSITPFLSGCVTSGPVPQTAAVEAATAQVSAQTPDPNQIALQHYRQAVSACERGFAFAAGTATRRLNCINQAAQQNFFPMWTEGRKAINARFYKYMSQAANLVDAHSISIQAYSSFYSYAREIAGRELNAVAQENERFGQDTSNEFTLNYDVEHRDQQAIEADEHNIAISNLENQMQAVADDRDEFEYCAELYGGHLEHCATEKLAFQTDLAMYRTMAGSIPQVEQQASSSPAQTLQQQDIQDDLDAIAGGVVP